ncbi:hypothetical protein [Polluticaenibacter yanchengensis]|uniref:DUF1648 domain-containing protein n=1 Tax=Polluticaenibacter yanchengensis TaxID=3014562 RepID=A0ABT4UGL4_9BACT|nr:hypothetical protein [Chitinophagaceae bacterium LY-5]
MALSNNPKVAIVKTSFDKVLEGLVVVSYIFLWGILFRYYGELPKHIPTPINVFNTDSYNHKNILVLITVISTLLAAGIFYLNSKPYLYSYPVTVTHKNAPKVYGGFTKFTRFLTLGLSLVSSAMIIRVVNSLNYKNSSLNNWMIVVFILVIMIPVIFLSIKSYLKTKKTM